MIVQDQGEFGTPKYDGIALAVLTKALDNREQGLAIGFGNLIEDEPVKDQGVDNSALIN